MLKKSADWINRTCLAEGFDLGELSFTFCSDDYLHKINMEYLNHDTYTDIITFDYSSADMVSGEIFISLDRIKENAQRLNLIMDNELFRVIIHGVLHLLGYKDKSPSEKAQMTSKEDYYLSLLPDLE
ncbi:MAG: rRNA maturation RNase YbeY [Bacteroidales bacterium]|nr:rRNA maturation RNase YbeY [Bacteroidales bacterium]